MLEVSKMLYDMLSSSDVFARTVEQRIFPVVAGEGVKYPFSIYTLTEEPSSQDGDEYDVFLHTYFQPNKIFEAMKFVDAAKEVIKESFFYEGSAIDFIDKDQSIVVSIYFKILQ